MTEQRPAYDPAKPLFAVDLEEAILGGVLIDPDVMTRLVHQVDADDFYLEKHRTLWQVLVDMHTGGQVIDVVTLYDALEQRALVDKVGGQTMAADLIAKVPSSQHVEWYATKAREYRVKREMVAACQAGVAAAFNGNGVSTALADLRKATSAAERMLVGDVTSLHHRQSLDSYMDLMETRYANRNNPRLVFPWPGLAGLMPYLEGGEPIGSVGPTMRHDRMAWAECHDTHADQICRKNCLDCLVDYNNVSVGIGGKP